LEWKRDVQEVSELLRVADKHLKKALEQIEDSREEAETSMKNIPNPVVADLKAEAAKGYIARALDILESGSDDKDFSKLLTMHIQYVLRLISTGIYTVHVSLIVNTSRSEYADTLPHCYSTCVEWNWNCIEENLATFTIFGILDISSCYNCIKHWDLVDCLGCLFASLGLIFEILDECCIEWITICYPDEGQGDWPQ